MPSFPTVSVIIPAYNAAEYLHRAVESALAQTVPPHEILIVDDGSRDNSYEVAAAMPAPVKAFKKANGGPASARNFACRQATGEWLAFLDADDTWLPGKLERQMSRAQPDTGMLHCLFKPAEPPPDRLTFDLLWEKNPICTSTVAIRRDVFLEAGGFDEDRTLIGVEDYNLWLKVAFRKWPIVAVQETLIAYTPATGSLTQQVERFARAELANLDKIAAELRLDSALVEAKRLAILDEYGRELLYYRNLAPARQYLRAALAKRFSVSRLAWWAAAMAPPAALRSWDSLRGRSR
jgi:glycosyltransferase involved in cell wall biosynthesis